jgi:imidazoleglycerol phosphate dehydratase HisB
VTIVGETGRKRRTVVEDVGIALGTLRDGALEGMDIVPVI